MPERMKLNFFAPIGGWIGYPTHARNFAKAIDRAGVDIAFFPSDIVSGRIMNPDKEMEPLLNRTFEADLSAPGICLTIPRPDMAVRFGGKRRILYTVYETSKLPDSWIPILNAMDEVWTVSKWGKNVFENSGVEKDVKVVPEGVDPVLYDQNRWYGETTFDEPLQSGFKFLYVGKWEERKNTAMLIRSFLKEFGEHEDAHLLLSCHNPFIKEFNPIVKVWESGIPFDKRIHFIQNGLSADSMASLYANMDAFVLPTRGEGWGLPIIEAMSSSLPCIAGFVGGQSEYLCKEEDDGGLRMSIPRSNIFFPLWPDGTSDADDGIFFKGDCGEWANIDEIELQTQMRYVYDNQDESRKVGKRAARYVRKEWTWDKAASKAIKVLDT